jgi:hypothetical protein
VSSNSQGNQHTNICLHRKGDFGHSDSDFLHGEPLKGFLAPSNAAILEHLLRYGDNKGCIPGGSICDQSRINCKVIWSDGRTPRLLEN